MTRPLAADPAVPVSGAPAGRRGVLLLHAATIAVGAFLLFQVQPIVARYILPWFGGTPAVWTTCMLVFQTLLLAGYAYAHWIAGWPARRAVVFHGLLAVACLAFLPIVISDAWKPADEGMPVARISAMLAATIGLPYLLLATTSPLVQSWAAREGGRSPYRLYALSNAGSLLALLSYPTVVEPLLGRTQQAWAWSAGFMVYVALLVATLLKLPLDKPQSTDPPQSPAGSGSRTWVDRWLWLALSMTASVLLLAVTAKICQDVAVVPFLWILPLSVYLLSFIVAFDSPRWYVRQVWMSLMMLGMAGSCWLLVSADPGTPIGYQLLAYVGTLLATCMVCHGEVARLKPDPSRLTGFYLTLAAGGALGGVFAAVLAPRLFSGYYELHLSIAAAAALAMVLLWRDPASPLHRGSMRIAWYVLVAGFVSLVAMLVANSTSHMKDAELLDRQRTFYGVLSVHDLHRETAPAAGLRALHHGIVNHGVQFTVPSARRVPTAYYRNKSGIGRLLRSFPPEQPIRVGVVGLGAGTLAAYGQAGDVYRFYEINPAVEPLARKYFTFLSDSAATIEVAMGDARLTLEREPPQAFDVLALDAFSGDAIPVHLLTREALAVYRRHLKPNGILAFHISNRHLDLEPVIRRLAEDAGLAFVQAIDEPEAGEVDGYTSNWMFVGPDKDRLMQPPLGEILTRPMFVRENVQVWTDDHSSLLKVLR